MLDGQDSRLGDVRDLVNHEIGCPGPKPRVVSWLLFRVLRGLWFVLTARLTEHLAAHPRALGSLAWIVVIVGVTHNAAIGTWSRTNIKAVQGRLHYEITFQRRISDSDTRIRDNRAPREIILNYYILEKVLTYSHMICTVLGCHAYDKSKRAHLAAHTFRYCTNVI